MNVVVSSGLNELMAQQLIYRHIHTELLGDTDLLSCGWNVGSYSFDTAYSRALLLTSFVNKCGGPLSSTHFQWVMTWLNEVLHHMHSTPLAALELTQHTLRAHFFVYYKLVMSRDHLLPNQEKKKKLIRQQTQGVMAELLWIWISIALLEL